MHVIQDESLYDSYLTDYYFPACELDYIDEYKTGYDKQGREWKGTKLLNLRQQDKITKEFVENSVFLHGGVLLGYIRECPDSTWLAHSCYLESMDYVELYGFKNKFYAVRYLHEIIIKCFPSEVYLPLPIPLLPVNRNNLEPEIDIFLKSLNARIGYIQKLDDNFWIADSLYHSTDMLALKGIGFSSETYAARYLFQIVEAGFPDLIEDEEIPEVSWIYRKSNNI